MESPVCSHVKVKDVGFANNAKYVRKDSVIKTKSSEVRLFAIYLLGCNKCPETFYVGQTINLRSRINNHLSSIMRNNSDQKIHKHFNLVDHCLSDINISILEIPDSDKSRVLDRIERQWITKIDTFKSGLNSDEGNSAIDACIFSLQHHHEANILVRAARDWLTKFKTDNKLYNESQLTITKIWLELNSGNQLND